jgi:glycosyltransferase involved in cell wall biosynthesis
MSRTKSSHTIVCLSSQPWQDGMWTNKQHIMSRLAVEHRVYYVEPVSIPLVRRAKRGVLREESGASKASLEELLFEPDHSLANGVNVLRFPRLVPGFVMQLEPSSPSRIFGDFDVRSRLLRRYLERRSIADAILWIYHPGYGGGALRVPHRLAVYDCVDEYAEFPTYRTSPAWLLDREEALCRDADVVFATSERLFEAKRDYNPQNTYLVHNVGDTAHFRRADDPATPVPEELARLPRPVVGFVGAVSPYKLDFEWIAHLARARPAWSVALVGPVGVGEENASVEPLRSLPNVHLFGHRDYSSLPGYVRGFDVAVIPYVKSRYTESCFPIKFFEFLASGRPVVISELPALAAYFDAVGVARTAEEFVTLCERAIDAPDEGKARRLELASANDWSSRIDKLMEQIECRLSPSAKSS